MKERLFQFLTCYLVDRNLEKTLEYLSEHVISIGTGEHETAVNKEEIKKLLVDEFAELPNAFEFELRNYTETSEEEHVRNFFSNVYVKLELNGETTEMLPRLTGTFVKCGEEWKITSLHMSTPTIGQEENTFFPLYYGTKTIGKMSAESETKLIELISDAIPGGIMGGYLEEGYPLYTINDKMLKMLGYTYEELIEATDEKMINVIHADDRKRIEKEIGEQFAKKGEYEVLYRAVGKNSRVIWVSDIGKKIITEDGREAMISIMIDVTERINHEKQLAEEASHDSLTQLYNRRKARSLMNEKFAEGNGGVLFICDVDHFKFVNDTRGHVFGDKILIELASIMKEYAGRRAIIGRLGGDEYILYFPASVKEEEAVRTIDRIRNRFEEYMQEQIPEMQISFSAGGTVRDCEEIKTLYQRADKALYQAKKKRGTTVLL